MANALTSRTDLRPEVSVRASEEHLRLGQEAGGIGTWAWDLRLGAMVWSDQMFLNLGLVPGQADASFETILARVHPADREKAACHLAGFRQRIGPVRMEVRVLWPGRDLHWIVFLGKTIPNERGQPAMVRGITIDRTSRRQREQAVHDDAERLRLVMKAHSLASWEFNVAKGTGHWSPEAASMHGLAPERTKLTTGSWQALLHPDDVPRALDALRTTIEQSTDYSAEYRVRHPDGSTRWLLSSGAVVPDPDNGPPRIVGVVQDVTERKLSHEALRESEERFRRVFEQSPLGKATAGLDFKFREVNPAFCAMVGYTAEELRGMSFLDLVHEDDRPRCLALGQALVEGTLPQFQVEERFVRKTGEPFWVSVNVAPIRDANGKVLYSLGVIEDIDERKRTREALRESERRLRELNETLEQQADERSRQLASSRAQLQFFFDSSPDWLTMQRMTPDGRFVYVAINPTTEKAYGLPREQVIGRLVEDVLGDEEARIPLQKLRECALTGLPQRYSARRTIGGRTRTIDVMCVLVPGESADGAPYIITTARDLTEREQLEAQLRQAQKMEAIGHLTGGVAHDFNNLLAVVIGNAELVKRKRGANVPALMDNILRAGERGVALTRQLLSFARRQTPSRRVIDLAVEMPRLAEMLRTSLRGDIDMRLSVPDDLWPIEVDLDELEIALLNIAVNARDAMLDGGRLTIDLSNAPPGPATLDREHVLITMRDTGTGIPPDALGKVFDPFFTTKARGVGTGLGLSQVYGFAHQSEGTVGIDSALGHGTTVSLRLPRTLKPLPAAPVAVDVQERAGGRILMVEDNPQVADVMTMMLDALGYETEVVSRARLALDRLNEQGSSFDLLLSDVVMPDGMHGLALAEEVRAKMPDLPIILMSGYNEAVVSDNCPFRLLRKPVPLQELRDAVGTYLTPRLPEVMSPR